MTCLRASNGVEFQVDAEDVQSIQAWEWSVYRFDAGSENEIRYVATSMDGKTIYLHRFLTDAQPGQEVDHRNGDGLDNRRCNLRVCSHAQNLANQRSQQGRSSRFRGVHFYRSRGKWQAYIKVNGVLQNLGYFKTEALAAKAYNKAALKAWGEFARLNKVEEAA